MPARHSGQAHFPLAPRSPSRSGSGRGPAPTTNGPKEAPRSYHDQSPPFHLPRSNNRRLRSTRGIATWQARLQETDREVGCEISTISNLGQQHQAGGSTPILHQPAKQVANFPENHHPAGISRVLKWGRSLHPTLVRPGSFLNRTTQPPAQSCCCSEHPRGHQAPGGWQQTANTKFNPKA